MAQAVFCLYLIAFHANLNLACCFLLVRIGLPSALGSLGFVSIKPINAAYLVFGCVWALLSNSVNVLAYLDASERL